MRLAKIVATVGPASQEPAMLARLIEAGVNVFRLNFSHGSHADKLPVIAEIRRLSQERGLSVGILGDLQGPKFRIGPTHRNEPLELCEHAPIHFSVGTQPSTVTHLYTDNPVLIEAIQPGQHVLLNDGALALLVKERVSSQEVVCEVLVGGLLVGKKGINVPDLTLPVSPITQKDFADAAFAVEQGLDFLALSYVQSYKDVLHLRQYLQEYDSAGPQTERLPAIVAKIEKPKALTGLDDIIQVSDGIMVARGDLGVELSPEKVPMIQKEIIRKSRQAAKPVITATQILESMIDHPTPTRAEVSDIANALLDGSDALMLSAETASGQYPLECVETMSKIIGEVESSIQANPLFERRAVIPREQIPTLKFHETIAHSAALAAEKSHTQAIVSISFSGSMAKRLSNRRPPVPIIALTPHESVCRRMSLYWGVYPLQIEAFSNMEKMFKRVVTSLKEHTHLDDEDAIVFCAGKTHLAGLSNFLGLYKVGDFCEQMQSVSAAEAKGA